MFVMLTYLVKTTGRSINRTFTYMYIYVGVDRAPSTVGHKFPFSGLIFPVRDRSGRNGYFLTQLGPARGGEFILTLYIYIPILLSSHDFQFIFVPSGIQ